MWKNIKKKMEYNIKNQLAKAFKNLKPNTFSNGNDIIFSFLIENNLKIRLDRNSFEVEFFLQKIGSVYYQKVLTDTEDEKVELKLDQLYWPQFLQIKRKCISETIADTLNILVKHPDVKRILKFIDRKDEENSIKQFLQQLNDYMVEYLNNVLVLKFKMMRKIALKTSYKRKAYRSCFQCQGCGDMCPEYQSPENNINVALNSMLRASFGPRFANPWYDSSSSESEENNEDQEDLSDSDEIEMKKKPKKKTHRKKVLHFSYWKR